MSIDLKDGYLFRTTDPQGYILDKQFIGSAVANRLNKHLTDLGIHNGETMHSFRSGCSITLSLLGVSYEQVAKHVGWKNVHITIYYYSQLNKVISLDDANTAISKAGETDSPQRTLDKKSFVTGRDSSFMIKNTSFIYYTCKIQIKPKPYPLSRDRNSSTSPLSHRRYSFNSPSACQVKPFLMVSFK